MVRQSGEFSYRWGAKSRGIAAGLDEMQSDAVVFFDDADESNDCRDAAIASQNHPGQLRACRERGRMGQSSVRSRFGAVRLPRSSFAFIGVNSWLAIAADSRRGGVKFQSVTFTFG